MLSYAGLVNTTHTSLSAAPHPSFSLRGLNPDSRRYVIFEVSSALKGNTDYFRHLSRFIDDAHCRYEFYEYLMARDISNVDWVNDRPISAFYSQMVEMNLPKEFEFLRDVVIMPEFAAGPGKTVRFDAKSLFEKFLEWLSYSTSTAAYNTNTTKFGCKMSSLCHGESSDNLEGCVKERKAEGVVYTFNVDVVVDAMGKRMWFGNDIPPSRETVARE